MDTERDVIHYEFTISPIGAMLSFDPPPDSPGATARPRGFPAQPIARWARPDGQPPSLSLTYPNLPRPARLVFRDPPLSMTLHLDNRLPFIVCQTRAGVASRAHYCSLDEPPESAPLAHAELASQQRRARAPEAT